MRWQGVLAVVAGAMWSVGSLAVMGAASAQAAPATSGTASASPWGKATEIPGLPGVTGNSVVCVSSGDCTATEKTDGSHAVVASESKGHWGKPIAVPGLSALIKTGDIFNITVSCGTFGDCALAGTWIGPKDASFAFVVSETNGKWAKAIRVPGLGALDTRKDADITSVSCSTGRDCVAGGWYGVASPTSIDAFVVSERNGHWGQATPVPGPKASGFARILTVDCTSDGNCSAGGKFSVGANLAGFVVNEKNGKWGKAIEVPGLGALSTGGDSEVDQMTCTSNGNCVAGGSYSGNDDGSGAFVVSEKNGSWGQAIPVPGLAALSAGGFADLQSMSCATPDNCAVGGTYKDAKFEFQGYVATEKDGTWGQAIEIPNLGKLNAGGNVQIVQVGCATAGNCVAGGSYLNASGEDSDTNAFVSSESKGTWGKATEVPGLSALNTSTASVNVISCPRSSHCTAFGSYDDRTRAFEVTHR